jgi:hypothetical protein
MRDKFEAYRVGGHIEDQKRQRRARVEWLRGRCHTITRAEAAFRLGVKEKMAQQYAKELGETFKPDPSKIRNCHGEIDPDQRDREVAALNRRMMELWPARREADYGSV